MSDVIANATPVMPLRDRAALVALAKVLGEAVKAGDAAVREGVLADLLDMYDDTGAKSIVVRLPGTDAKVATITLTEPTDKAAVVDEKKLTAWVKKNRRTEVVTTTTVRESFLKWLLGNVELDTTTGECLLVDQTTGETQVVPGLLAKPKGRPSSFSLRFETDGRDEVKRAALTGGIGLEQLVAADTSETAA